MNASEIKYCAKCERCHDDGLRDDEDCKYYGEPCGCNHPNRGFAESANETNEQIADAIEKRVADSAPNWDFAPTLREAAARLRKTVELTPEMATEMCRRESDLRAKLKVAEDALEKLKDRLVSSVHDGTSVKAFHDLSRLAHHALDKAVRELQTAKVVVK